MDAQQWTTVAEPPALFDGEFGWPQSIPVLGYFTTGEMRVVTFEDHGDKDAPELHWFTNCSERWNVTGRVTHWMPLPAAPVN